MSHVSQAQAKQLIGKEVYAVRRDGSVMKGRLTGIRGNELVLEPTDGKARTRAILPLALFDVLALGTLPFAGFGFGGPGFGFGGPGFGFGGPGFWW